MDIVSGGMVAYNEYITMTAIPHGNDTFIGWYLNDELVSSDPSYSFFATQSQSYTARFTKTSSSIVGNITSYNPNNATTIQLMQDGEVKYTTTIASEEGSGQVTQQFTMSEIEEGIYDMVISKEGHLTYTITGINVSSEDIDLTQSEKEYSNITLIAGDVNGDGSVTEGDVMMIRYSTNMNRTVSAAANPAADLNGDGSITEGDVLIVRYRQHINKGTQNCTFGYDE